MLPKLSRYFQILLFPLLFTLWACSSDLLFEQEYSINETGWTYQDTLDFVLDVPDTSSIYDLNLKIEHTKEFPFQNLYLNLYTAYPSGLRVQKHLSIDLMDKFGQWQGRCGREKCKLTVGLQKNVYFNQLGKHTITIEQFTRIDSLSGIEKVGIELFDTGQKR